MSDPACHFRKKIRALHVPLECFPARLLVVGLTLAVLSNVTLVFYTKKLLGKESLDNYILFSCCLPLPIALFLRL